MLISNVFKRLFDTLAGSKGAPSLETRILARFGRGSTSDLPNFMNAIGAYRMDLRKPLVVARFGSSVGNGASQTNPLQSAPGAHFTRRLKQLFDPADRLNISEVNYCVDGSTISGFAPAWAAMKAAGVKPIIVHMCYGMNDWQPAQFNSGQTFGGFGPTLEAAVNTARNDGADVILYTTPQASIVNHGAALYSMPAVIPQTYPVDAATPAKPPPVLPEQMTPPASQSSKTVDYLGDGIMVTVDVRTLAINDQIRAVGRRLGVLVLEADKCYIEALQEAIDRLGSQAEAEKEFFNFPNESVHFNDHGNAVTYQRATDEFLLSFCHQLSQGAVEKTGGYGGMNVPVRGLAAWEVRTPRGDTTTKPISFWANTGPIQAGGDGLNEADEWLNIDPATGNLVHGKNATTLRAPMTAGGIVTEVEHVRVAYGVHARQKIEGKPNMFTAAPWTIGSLPDNGAGRLTISAQNGGVLPNGYQVNFYRWVTKEGTLVLVADGASIGSGLFTVAVVGLAVRITVTADSTPVQVEWQSLAV